ncbi:MAG: ribbon-helix-helix protein, CopG family [Chloroflexi bacterium]|nr:ribbon-helix-helix protein, CopG family [Chloroflexota bacterium]
MLIHVHRTQLLLPPDLHERAKETARARGMSLGNLVREALQEYLARSSAKPSPDAIDRLLADPFDDPDPDPYLSVDHDYYLYGAKRKSRSGR